jgi:neutral ceramidase
MPSQTLHVGRAELKITPPLGISIAGYYNDRKADNIITDLYAHAVVLSSGEVTAALVVCDLISLKREVTILIRQSIAQRTGIPIQHVMIGCTHTHTGPNTYPWPEINVYPDDAYMNVLSRVIADSVVLAFQRQEPAFASVAHGQVEGVAFNRRYWMKDGSLRTNPPFQSPEIVKPAGPLDPELGLLMLRSATNTPLALLTNYALHPDQVGGTAYCADYEGVMSDLLKGAIGQQCAILCSNGCAGDINHFDMSKPGPQKGFACAERSGRAIAGEAIRRLSDLTPVGDEALRIANRTVSVPFRVPNPDEVAWARQLAGQDMNDFDENGLNIVKADRIIAIHERGESQISTEISAIAIGNVALVALPGEIFTQLGLDIKKRSPFPHTFIIELCNDNVDYVPTRQVYDEGGYEAASSRFAPGAGELFVDAAVELLNGLL